jgi:hypothetical protein
MRDLAPLLAAAAWALAGCGSGVVGDARAQAPDAAALSAQGWVKGGVLACSGINGSTPSSSGPQVWSTALDLFNHNDGLTISIDRVVLYRGDGSTLCDLPGLGTVGPHQILLLVANAPYLMVGTTPNLNCPLPSPLPSVPNGQFTFLIWWSYEKPSSLEEVAWRNPLDGYAAINVTEQGTGVLRGRSSRECAPIKVPPAD